MTAFDKIVAIINDFSPTCIKALQMPNSKHLLGFSAGVDSSALFFVLNALKVRFDIAIVHYHIRSEAEAEVAHAVALAKKHKKQCFIAHAPVFSQNFEESARIFRFSFFESLIKAHSYDSLILAHQLDDRLEWLMMQLGKGASLSNLLGFEDSRIYNIYRPLAFVPKYMLYNLCKECNIVYFEDKSNADTSYKRNYIRQQFAAPFMQAFANGVARSMAYLEQDKALLLSFSPKMLPLTYLANAINALDSAESSINNGISSAQSGIYAIYYKELAHIGEDNRDYMLLLYCDKIAKKLGYVLSSAQRDENKKAKFMCKMANIIIAKNHIGVFLALDICNMYQKVTKYATHTAMHKDFKRICARHSIPPKLRGLVYSEFCAFCEAQQIDSQKMALQAFFKQNIGAFFAF